MPPSFHGPLCTGPLPAGALTVLLGPAGSGKTRLLRRIAHHLTDDEPGARIILADTPATAVPSLRVFEALLLAHKQGDRWAVGAPEIQAVGASLEQVGLAHAAGMLVNALDANARQRLRLAQALIRQPDALLLDESEHALSAQDQAGIAAQFKNAAIAQGFRAVMATPHAHVALQVADKLLVLHHGRLIAEGAPAEMLARVKAGDIDPAALAP
ncbi:ATP-binding cassette domain-containing protein [Achromobacter sp. UMC71]|uniref:ATP-binding cassette domain-containing protein n=1 Tax=Achromobacter sp. UMC71 TaxID=1862320 RepID=UPI00351C4BD8